MNNFRFWYKQGADYDNKVGLQPKTLCRKQGALSGPWANEFWSYSCHSNRVTLGYN